MDPSHHLGLMGLNSWDKRVRMALYLNSRMRPEREVHEDAA